MVSSRPAKAAKVAKDATATKKSKPKTERVEAKPLKKEAKQVEAKPASESESDAEEEEEEEEENEEKDSDEENADDDDDDENVDGEEEDAAPKSFKELGLTEVLYEICGDQLKYAHAMPIQEKVIPIALQGRDIVATAETGSGKTMAFVLPMLHALLAKPQRFFGLVVAPTRELAVQISQSFKAFHQINLKCTVLLGGVNMMEQKLELAKKPHVIVATPGRLLDHLQKTNGFSLRRLRCLVLDEADRMLDMDFGPTLQKIVAELPRDRQTMLFSATMPNKVEMLQRASVRADAERIKIARTGGVDGKAMTVAKLQQKITFTGLVRRDQVLIHLLTTYRGYFTVIFVRTTRETERLALFVRNLGFNAVPLHGKMPQSQRLSALNKLKAGSADILVATDVAARGLDLPTVKLVLNYDLPNDSATYVHRVGRTARAGKGGLAISLLTQYNWMHFKKIEQAIGLDKQIDKMEMDKAELDLFRPHVDEALRKAREQMREEERLRDEKKRRRRGGIGGGGGGANLGKRRRDDMDIGDE